MTPAQLGTLIDQHNAAHAPADGKHARTSTSRGTAAPAELAQLAGMRFGG